MQRVLCMGCMAFPMVCCTLPSIPVGSSSPACILKHVNCPLYSTRYSIQAEEDSRALPFQVSVRLLGPSSLSPKPSRYLRTQEHGHTNQGAQWTHLH